MNRKELLIAGAIFTITCGLVVRAYNVTKKLREEVEVEENEQ